MSPDGLSYLDMASAAAQGRPGALVNGYWSPGYPALIALALGLLEPSPEYEFQVIHLVNLLTFVGALLACLWWLRGESFPDSPSGDGLKSAFVPFALCVFVWFVLFSMGIRRVTPDILVAAIVFLAAGCVSRLTGREAGLWSYGRLGLVLALGYYVKTALLPLGLALLCILLIAPPSRVRRSRLLLSLFVFVLLSSPLVAALSARTGHLTIGESGRLNYAWYVNGVQIAMGWTGGPTEEYGVPEHPPRTLATHPRTLEFREPVPGTYPLWYEPSYWYAGVKPAFELGKQLTVLKETLTTYSKLLLRMGPLVAGAIVLLGLALIERRPSPSLDRDHWWQLTWPLAACLMYSLAYVNIRYVSAFMVLLWLALYRALALCAGGRTATPVLATVGCALIFSFGTEVRPWIANELRDAIRSVPPAHRVIGQALREEGVAPGDVIAVVGEAHEAYYARYAGVRILAQVPDAEEFWGSSPEEREILEKRLASLGVEAIVATGGSAAPGEDGWRDVSTADGERVSMLVLEGPLARALTPRASTPDALGDRSSFATAIAGSTP